MSDLASELREMLPDLEHGKGTHEIWANCDQKYRDENPDIGDVNFHLENVKIYEQRIKLVTEAADLIEQQQARVSELEEDLAEHKCWLVATQNSKNKLAATVERLRGAAMSVCAAPHESGNLGVKTKDHFIYELGEIIDETPPTSLNAVRREVARDSYREGYYEGFQDSKYGIFCDDDKLNGQSYANKRYPDKE